MHCRLRCHSHVDVFNSTAVFLIFSVSMLAGSISDSTLFTMEYDLLLGMRRSRGVSPHGLPIVTGQCTEVVSRKASGASAILPRYEPAHTRTTFFRADSHGINMFANGVGSVDSIDYSDGPRLESHSKELYGRRVLWAGGGSWCGWT